MRRSFRFLLLLLLGALAALALGELLFCLRDDGAFPHLNVYEPDAALGVHLRPGATERVAFGGNAATEVRINASGFRGADWPAPSPNEIIVVGDSQVFGLGVEEGDSLPARLALATGRPVINAGVPTYGPEEYLAVIDRLLVERHPKTVVAVINFSNDLFERDRPNRERHKVWDGWAVRAETMPTAVTDFPGRSWLFRESHLLFAARRALYTPTDPADLGVPSEGGFADLLPQTATPEVNPEPTKAPRKAAAEAAQERVYTHDTLMYLLTEVDPTWTYDDRVAAQAVLENSQPGDIVYEREAEGARGVPVTAELLQRGAKMRRVLIPTLREWVAKHGDPKTPSEKAQFESVRRALAEWDDQVAILGQLATTPESNAALPSALHGWLVETAAHVEEAGAELLVVALPLDVQVSPKEWAKYGKPETDLTDTRVLLDDLVAEAQARGIRAVSLVPALQTAEPGAFLKADLHMSPKGTDAAAIAIATALAELAPIVKPGPGYPKGRSRMPTWEEMVLAEEILVPGSTRNRCSTRQSREWLVVDCAQRSSSAFGASTSTAPGIAITAAPLESAWLRSAARTSVLLPLIPGYDATIELKWPKVEEPQAVDDSPWLTGRREQLTVRWSGDKPTIRFAASSARFTAAKHDSVTERCLADGYYNHGWVNETRGCSGSFASCRDQLSCSMGLGPSPVCAEGTGAVGSPGWCYVLCSATAPCAEGKCTAWEGAHVCL